MATALNASQTRKISERISAVNWAMKRLHGLVMTGKFNFYGTVPAAKLIVPLTGQTGEASYDVHRRLMPLGRSIYHVRRLTSSSAMSDITKLVCDGYVFVDDVSEVARILSEQGETE